MGARIEAVEICGANRGDSSRDLAVRAALKALSSVGWEPADLGLLINTGIYRDEHICEPAMAPFIQERIGANPGLADDGGLGTFSFDLANGGCGLLNACHVADGLLASGDIGRALIVGSDVDPTPESTRGYPFDPAGAALLLSRGDGFERFLFESFAEHAELFESRVDFEGDPPCHTLNVHRNDGFLEACAHCCIRTVGALLEEAELFAADLDLMVCAPFPPGLSGLLAPELGIERERIVDSLGGFGVPHTAGLGISLSAAIQSGRFRMARRTLLLTVGAGITVGAALYVQ